MFTGLSCTLSHVGGEPIKRLQTRVLRPFCLRIQFFEIIIFCYVTDIMRFVSDIIICFLLTHGWDVGHRWERVVLLMWFSSCSYRNRFAVCSLFARLKPSAPEVNPDNMSKATDGILCTVNIMCIYVPTLSFKINRLTVKRTRRFY